MKLCLDSGLTDEGNWSKLADSEISELGGGGLGILFGICPF